MNRDFGWYFGAIVVAAAIIPLGTLLARSDGLTRGPIVVISDPDPGADFKIANWSNSTNECELETTVTVNPANPNNIASIWRAQNGSANAVSMTFDGGVTWQLTMIPGISVFTGGVYGDISDPWLAFGPDGTLYATSIGLGNGQLGTTASDVLISRSTDGGRTWRNPVLVGSSPSGSLADRPSITPDPGNSNYVYATWPTGILGPPAPGTVQFSRSTDGGTMWEAEWTIYKAPAGNATWAPQIMVLPNGTLVCIFTELVLTGYVGTVPQYSYTLSVMRSRDKGITWSAPIQAAAQNPRPDSHPKDTTWWGTVTDPNNGHEISAVGMGHAVAMDPRNGNLYAVWQDTRFTNGQYNSIAFSQSTDGGLTWSAPIQVNQTPNSSFGPGQQAFLPAIAVAADGTIGVSYYDLRFEFFDQGHGCSTDYWLATCTPAPKKPCTDPANWANETRLTDVSFNAEAAVRASRSSTNDYWLGDYTGLAAVGNSFVATWAQPYAGSPDRILFRKVGP